MKERKADHIKMAFDSRVSRDFQDRRFYYEPMLKAHTAGIPGPVHFGEQQMNAPVWIASMTGGTPKASLINTNLAKACKEFGLGMGLGSCRIILEDDTYFEDFNMRPLIGNQPLFANLGIAQIENIILEDRYIVIEDLIKRLKADGLIIHVNPLQEWFQPEGDKLKKPPIETIKTLLNKVSYPLIVKEVGQGFGYESLKSLLELPLLAVEFGAFGGSNFVKMELQRSENQNYKSFEPFSRIGHDAEDMLEMTNEIIQKYLIHTKHLIISGGIRNCLDGYYLIRKSHLPSIYGMASEFLRHAQDDYNILREFVSSQLQALELAYNYLTIRQ